MTLFSSGALVVVEGDAIRRELKTSRYVAYFRPGAQNEGGDGATIVWLT